MKTLSEMVREAGLPEAWISKNGVLSWEQLKRFSKLVRADERARMAEQPAQQEYERGFIDGMQEQMKRSVDKAVNAMTQRTWVGLTDEDLANCSGHEVRWALYWEKLLKDKNNV